LAVPELPFVSPDVVTPFSVIDPPPEKKVPPRPLGR
jgi:hypothetical protein